MLFQGKDNWIIENKEFVSIIDLVAIIFVFGPMFTVFLDENTTGLLASLFGVVWSVAVIIILVKIERKNIDYYPKRVYYHRLNNGLDEYRYTYFFWEKNKKEGCIRALQDNGVTTIYKKQITPLRQMVYGNQM